MATIVVTQDGIFWDDLAGRSRLELKSLGTPEALAEIVRRDNEAYEMDGGAARA